VRWLVIAWFSGNVVQLMPFMKIVEICGALERCLFFILILEDMWQEILSKAKDNISGEIRNKAGLNQEQADKSIEMAGDSTREVLLSEAKQGNVQEIMSLFRGQKPSNSGHPLANKISGSLIDKLVSQFGLSQDMAAGVERVAVPYLLDLVNKKAGGAQSAPSPASLVSLLGGTDKIGGDVQEKLKKGLDKYF
jgi:hypothetical protein